MVAAAERVEEIAKGIGRPITIRKKRYRLFAVTHYERAGDRKVSATVYGVPTGFWVWQTTGTRAHLIKPHRGTRKGWPRVIAGKGWDHPTSVAVKHPGTSGRGAWRKVRAQAEHDVPQIIRDAMFEAARKVA